MNLTNGRPRARRFVRRFADISLDDIPFVGGKNASLGELQRALGPQGVRLADGFAVTAEAYREFLRMNRLDKQIHQLLSQLNTQDTALLQRTGSEVRHLIPAAPL